MTQPATARALTTEEEGRYRMILAGRGRDWNKRDWTSLDIAALLATLDAVRAEATAAAEQRLRAVRAGIEALIEERGGRCVQPGDFEAEGLNICEAHHELMFDGYCEDDPRDLRAVLALLDTPPAASPRQGEPVEGLDVGRLAEAIKSLAHGRCCWDAEQDAVDLAAAYFRLSRAALSEPAEAGEPAP